MYLFLRASEFCNAESVMMQANASVVKTVSLLGSKLLHTLDVTSQLLSLCLYSTFSERN